MSLRHFLTCRDVRLPLTLTEELDGAALLHRNTVMRAEHDAQGRVIWLEKVVYGELEMRHDGRDGEDGTLRSATIRVADEDARELHFDAKDVV